jgi:uncharacterized protein YegJ (DUF2314 family)
LIRWSENLGLAEGIAKSMSAALDSKAPGIPLFADLNDIDPAVVEVVSEARRTLPLFLDAASKMRFSPASYLVKVPFIDTSQLGEQALVRTAEAAAENPTRPICHLWLTVTSIFDDLIFCSVAEAPDKLNLKRDASFVVASESIEDWMINSGGTAFGGFSLRVIRSRLGEKEQMKFDAHTGIREFKKLMP